MKYRADMHVHSTFSCDSTCVAEDHVRVPSKRNALYMLYRDIMI
jgi:histidinol phosphatase-like PHP family hydrolase